jgi:hypothetical protein
VKNDNGTQYEARALNGLEEPLEKKSLSIQFYGLATLPRHLVVFL